MFTPEEEVYEIVVDFVRTNKISSPEAIHRSDTVIENARWLIQNLCDIVGYCPYPEDK